MDNNPPCRYVPGKGLVMPTPLLGTIILDLEATAAMLEAEAEKLREIADGFRQQLR